MNAFLLYVVQSALCLSLFYGLYLLLLRREAFFRFNRCVLLTVMVLSMCIPLIHVPVSEPVFPMIQKFKDSKIQRFKDSKIQRFQDSKIQTFQDSKIQIFQDSASPEIIESLNSEAINEVNFEILEFIPLVYLAGFFISLAMALVSFFSLARVIVTARPVIFRQQRILVSPLQISSFTFAGWIVIPEMDYERFAAEIIIHENIHHRSGHFWDLCLVNIIAVFHWFNPLVWLLQREVKSLHEYEADRCTLLHHGINATRYQLLLIEKAAGASRYSVASSFAQSKIKNRIIMMLKQNPNLWARWKALFFLPLAALLTLAFARPEINREIEQISALKGTEILQENTGWTEEKFLDELRKCLPAGVSRDLSYEDTWNEIAKTYQFIQNGKYSEKDGMSIKMNARGQMLINGKYATIDEAAYLLANNLSIRRERDFFQNINGGNINGTKTTKFIFCSWIQRDVNTPPDDYKKLLNVVGEAYNSKRDEMARKYYQTGYDALDTDKKAEVDDFVPILVMIDIPKGASSSTQRIIQGGSWKDVEKLVNSQNTNSAEKVDETKDSATTIDNEVVVNVYRVEKENMVLFQSYSVSKDRNIRGSINLFEDIQYKFIIGSDEKSLVGAKIDLFNRLGTLIARSYDPQTGKMQQTLDLQLKNSGVYFIMINFETKLSTDEEWKKAEAEHVTVYVKKEEIENHEIVFNGKTIKNKDLASVIPEQFKNQLNQSRFLNIGRFTSGSNEGKDMLYAFELFSDKSFILNEKWVRPTYIDWLKITSINTFTGDEAVERYGNDAQNGIIAITTK